MCWNKQASGAKLNLIDGCSTYHSLLRWNIILGNNEEESIDEYLHTYYSDIEEQYQNEIYKLLP